MTYLHHDFLWSESVSEHMFEDNEEMLKRNVVRVKLPTKLQTALNHLHNIWSYSDIASLAGQN